VHEGRDKLHGPSRTALVHRIGMGSTYICHTVTGACCFYVRGVLRPVFPHSAGWPRPHTCDWLELRACPAGDAFTAISTISFTCSWRAECAACMYRVRSRGRPRPQAQAYFSPCTRGGILRASCPAAHVQLAYLDACTCSHHRLSSVYSPAYPSVVTSWRPTRLTSGCNHAQKGSPVHPNGLVYITYGWV
jgi:hypothetical protein